MPHEVLACLLLGDLVYKPKLASSQVFGHLVGNWGWGARQGAEASSQTLISSTRQGKDPEEPRELLKGWSQASSGPRSHFAPIKKSSK